MKKHFTTLLLIASFFNLSAQTLKEGDNLVTEFKKIITPYFFKAPNFTNWAEATNMFFIGDKPILNDCDFVFLALSDTTLIGVFNTKTSNEFMFDMAGNSILSHPVEYFLLPSWTVKKKIQTNSSDRKILSLLDKMYEQTLQANEIELEEATVLQYQDYQTNTKLANRHIAILFDNYQTIISHSATSGNAPPSKICLPLLKLLSEECLSLFNTIPSIVCIYMGEALQSAGMIDLAREHFKTSLQFYPNSIPLLVYNYMLEQDKTKRSQQFSNLKKKYGKHWMVKDL